MSNEKLGTVIKLAHNLIKIEVHKLRKIPLLTSYKDDVIDAIGELFRFYNIVSKRSLFK